MRWRFSLSWFFVVRKRELQLEYTRKVKNMIKTYDVIIIGSGPAAMAAVYPIKQSGKSVAIIEGARFGGTCPNFGCDPKKILYAKSGAAWQARQLAGRGVSGEVKFN